MEISCKKYCFSWGIFISVHHHWQENISYANSIISLCEKSNFTEAWEHLRSRFIWHPTSLSAFVHIIYFQHCRKRLTRFLRISYESKTHWRNQMNVPLGFALLDKSKGFNFNLIKRKKTDKKSFPFFLARPPLVPFLLIPWFFLF